MSTGTAVRDVRQDESEPLGRLLVDAYASLPGFPAPADQPGYYELLANVGRFAARPGARVLVAVSAAGEVCGGVVYFGDMAAYASGGSATTVADASGIRFLGVGHAHRAKGIGRALTEACIRLARQDGRSQVILHTTQAMHVAWRLYTELGFRRSDDLDFAQQGLQVFGFRLALRHGGGSTRADK
jgi:GNAT superfamily N-acetyltransferase